MKFGASCDYLSIIHTIMLPIVIVRKLEERLGTCTVDNIPVPMCGTFILVRCVYGLAEPWPWNCCHFHSYIHQLIHLINRAWFSRTTPFLWYYPFSKMIGCRRLEILLLIELYWTFATVQRQFMFLKVGSAIVASAFECLCTSSYCIQAFPSGVTFVPELQVPSYDKHKFSCKLQSKDPVWLLGQILYCSMERLTYLTKAYVLLSCYSDCTFFSFFNYCMFDCACVDKLKVDPFLSMRNWDQLKWLVNIKNLKVAGRLRDVRKYVYDWKWSFPHAGGVRSGQRNRHHVVIQLFS